METHARQSSLVTPRRMAARGQFGMVRTKRKLMRETPTRMKRFGQDDVSITESQITGVASQKSLFPSIKKDFSHERSSSHPRIILRHFQMDTSMLDEESGDGTPPLSPVRSTEKPQATTDHFPQPQDFIQELIQKYAANSEYNFSDIANRSKSQKPIDVFWEKRSGIGYIPSSRTSATFTMINRRVYLFGGECRSRFNDVKVLNPDIWKWESPPAQSDQGDPPPEPRLGHSAVGFRNSLVVFGGAGAFNSILKLRNCFNRVHIYDTISNIWKTAEPFGQSPTVRRNHACALIGNSMLVYGGMDEVGNVLDDIYMLNLETMRWSIPRIHKSSGVRPGKRHSMTMVAAYQVSILRQYNFDIYHMPSAFDETFTRASSGIYMFGGANQAGIATNDLFVLKPKPIDIKDDDYYLKWSQPDISGTPPEPRYAYSAALKGKYIVFFGGRNDAIGRGGIIVHSLALLNIESMRWETVTVNGIQPAGRWGACASTFGSQVIIFGGLRLEAYCSCKLVVLELDSQTVAEKKTEYAYIKDAQKLAGAKAFQMMKQASLVMTRAQPRVRELRHQGQFSS